MPETKKPRSLLDLMPKEQAEKALARAKKRLGRNVSHKGAKVPPEIYMTAEFGYYFGWAGVEAVRNNEITMEEMSILLEGARKVWYTKLVEQSSASSTANSFKTEESSYEKAMKPFTDRAEIG